MKKVAIYWYINESLQIYYVLITVDQVCNSLQVQVYQH